MDNLVWAEQDARANDYMHPSEAGCRKVTEQLLKFLKTDPGARLWFLKPGALWKGASYTVLRNACFSATTFAAFAYPSGNSIAVSLSVPPFGSLFGQFLQSDVAETDGAVIALQ